MLMSLNNGLIPMPENFKEYNASTTPCDFVQGPCACGAYHKIEEWNIDILSEVIRQSLTDKAIIQSYAKYGDHLRELVSEVAHDYLIAKGFLPIGQRPIWPILENINGKEVFVSFTQNSGCSCCDDPSTESIPIEYLWDKDKQDALKKEVEAQGIKIREKKKQTEEKNKINKVKKLKQDIAQKFKELAENQVQTPPEIAAIIEKEFWNMV